MNESKRKRYLWLAVLGFLFGFYCLYAAAYNAWLTAYYTDNARVQVHAIWLYVFLALAVISIVLSGVLVYKFKRRNSSTKNTE